MMIPISHTLQVTSFGGSATTTLLNWLIDNQLDIGTGYEWKHKLTPPNKNMYYVPKKYRPLYLIGNPVDSIISIFRRRIQYSHGRNMKCSVDLKHWTIQDYINHNQDLFHIDKQVRSWTSSKQDYPILCLKYDAIWNNVDVIFEFWNLDSSLKDSFPQRKGRNNSKRFDMYRDDLGKLYKNTTEYIDSLSDCFIV